MDALKGIKVIAGEIFIPVCCSQLTEPEAGKAFAELLAALLVCILALNYRIDQVPREHHATFL
jgi:hypothetical protein